MSGWFELQWKPASFSYLYPLLNSLWLKPPPQRLLCVERLQSGFKLRLKVQWKLILCKAQFKNFIFLVSTFIRCCKLSQSCYEEKRGKKSVSDIASTRDQAENHISWWKKNTWLHCFQRKYCSLSLGEKEIVFWSTIALACFLWPQRKLSTKYPDRATGRRMSPIFLCRHLCSEDILLRISELLTACLQTEKILKTFSSSS